MKHQSQYILALDQGTTSSRAIIFDHSARVMSLSQQKLTQIYPQEGWVEHDPLEIYATQKATLEDALQKANLQADQIAAIGMTNQRETTIVWNKHTGKPVYHAIVWQCRRTIPICEKLKKAGLEQYVQENTGLMIDPYFSGTKIRWILDYIPNQNLNDLLFGTVDSWLIWNLSHGQTHVIDYTNASRTMLFNINTLEWDQKLLDALEIPLSMMPEVKPSSTEYCQVSIDESGIKVPIAGIAGDQQAALFGHLCTQKGQAKNTYGTGCFLLMNTGQEKITSHHGLLTTLACGVEGEPVYALEGSVFIAGAAIQWLRDEIKLIDEAKDSEYFATQVDSSHGVYVVPAFTGLGTPYWNPHARGMIVGLTRDTNFKHLIRATLESIAYQNFDVLEAMQSDSGITLDSLKVDGGAVANHFLMQFQADILNVEVLRPHLTEVTALGAAYLAGLAVGYWKSTDDLMNKSSIEQKFVPTYNEQQRQKCLSGWKKAIQCSQVWTD